MLKRLGPVLLLFVLSPLVAEYLSGSMSMSQIGYLPFMAMLYGGGAVLIRELARRTHRGWMTILFLGLAYGLLEEGIAIQTLFNPHFHGLRLLDYGFVPALGIAVPWTVYVLTIHVVWSIMVPIALVEILFPLRRTEPWLGGAGFAVIALIYAAGIAIISAGIKQQEHFLATPSQFEGAALAVLMSVVLAFILPLRRRAKEDDTLSPWIVAVAAFLAGSAFVFLFSFGSNTFHWPWEIVAGGMLALAIGILLFSLIAARKSGWSDMHRFALAAGGVLVYCWFGFFSEIGLHGKAMLWAHAVLVVAMLALLIVVGLRAKRSRA